MSEQVDEQQPGLTLDLALDVPRMPVYHDLPPFLKKCRSLRDRFPQHVRFFEPNREAELATSLVELLATENASELLLSCLGLGKYLSHHVVAEDEVGPIDIAWLSNDTFISYEDNLHNSFDLSPLECVFTAHIEFSRDDVDEDGNDRHLFCNILNGVSLYRIVRIDIPIASLVDPTDTLLRILAKKKRLAKIRVCKHNRGDMYPQLHFPNDPPVPALESFPASLAALKDFVSKAASRRLLDLDEASLTTDQWRVVISNCHETNVKLLLRHIPSWLGTSDGEDPLAEALRLNQCPTNIELSFCRTTEHRIKEFLAALEVNTSLKVFTLKHMRKNCLDVLFRAISRNKGLERVTLENLPDMSDSEWELFWGTAMASHPTLKGLDLHGYVIPRGKRHIVVQSLRSNTVLCTLKCGAEWNDRDFLTQEINPILELNYFRPRVQAIKDEPDLLLRERLFSLMLLDPKVIGSKDDESNNLNSKCPSLCYFFLKENRDLLVKFSCLEDLLLRQWNETLHRLAFVEERMSGSGLKIPSLDSFLGKRKWS